MSDEHSRDKVQNELTRHLRLVARFQPTNEIPGRLSKLLRSDLLDYKTKLQPDGVNLIWFRNDRVSLEQASTGMHNLQQQAMVDLFDDRELVFRTGYKDGKPEIWFAAMTGVKEYDDEAPVGHVTKPESRTPEMDTPLLVDGLQLRLTERLDEEGVRSVREAFQNTDYTPEDFTVDELCALAKGIQLGFLICPEEFIEPFVDLYCRSRDKRNCLSVILFPNRAGRWRLAVFTPGDEVRRNVWEAAQAIGCLEEISKNTETGSLMANVVSVVEAVRTAEFLANFDQPGTCPMAQ